MNPKAAETIVMLIAQLVAFLQEMKKNGQIDDAALDAAVAGTNAETRAVIKQFLAS